MPARRDVLKAGGGGLALAAAGVATRWGAWTPAVRFPDADTWPQERYGPRNTGHSPDASPPRSNPAAVHRYDTGESANTVVVDADRVYAGTEHAVWAYERDGDRYSRWDEPADGRRLTVGPGVVVAGGRGRLTGFDPETGAVRWEHRPESLVYDVVVGEQTAYVGRRDGVVAYDTATGARRWRLPADGDVFVGFDGHGRLLVTGDGADGVAAYGPRSALSGVVSDAPRRVWAADEPLGGTHPVVADDGASDSRPGRLLVGTSTCLRSPDCGLAAVDPGRGVDWRTDLGNNAGRVAFDGERAYVVSMRYGDSDGGVNYSDDTTLHAVDAATGEELWTFERGGWFSSPVVADGTVYVGERGSPNGNGNLHALDAETGAVLWTFDRTAGVNALAPVGDALYVATDGGRVLGLA